MHWACQWMERSFLCSTGWSSTCVLHREAVNLVRNERDAALSGKDTRRWDEKSPKLAAPGRFLAGSELYDEHGHMLPAGTVPALNPTPQPEQGAIMMDPREQCAGAPEGPATPDTWGGTISESRAQPSEHEQNVSSQQTPSSQR